MIMMRIHQDSVSLNINEFVCFRGICLNINLIHILMHVRWGNSYYSQKTLMKILIVTVYTMADLWLILIIIKNVGNGDDICNCWRSRPDSLYSIWEAFSCTEYFLLYIIICCGSRIELKDDILSANIHYSIIAFD